MATAKAKATETPAKFDPSKVKRTRVVSLPTLSVTTDAPVYVKFESEIKQRTINEGESNERKFQYAQVTDHMTGELMNLNVDNGILWALDANYDGHEYVGKSFEITGYKEQGKRFMKFRIVEIEV